MEGGWESTLVKIIEIVIEIVARKYCEPVILVKTLHSYWGKGEGETYFMGNFEV